MAVQRALLAAFLVAVPLAGCLSSSGGGHGATPPVGGLEPLTNATHALGRFISTSVASFDGTELHIDLQLPDGPGPFPVILTDTPYAILGEEVSGTQADLGMPFDDGYVGEYVPYGYAVATAHVRGTGESGGCLTIGDPVEGRDGYALVEWLAAQPWSNGKVAMIGTSYDGTTPLETAVWAPPHLTTIVPISPVTEWYRYYFELGTHRRNADPFPGSSDTDPALWTGIGLIPGVRTGATGGLDDALCPGTYALEDDAQDDYDAYWHARDHHAKAGNITASMLFAHGWEDGNVAPTGFPSLWANVTSEKRLWVQQHGHGVPASKTAYHEYTHRWMDYWLLGRQNGALLLPQVIVEDNNGRFRAEADWPPRDAAPQRFNLSADGHLARDAGQPGAVSYLDTSTASTQLPGLPGQPVPDMAVFTTAPLDAPLHLAGAPTLSLTAQTELMGGQFDANLYDVAPDGTQAYVSRGFLDARHADSLEQGTDTSPVPREYRFPLHFNDHVVAAGHSLRLTLKSSDDYVVRSPYHNDVVMRVGKGKSWLDVPVIPDAGRTLLDDAPAPWSQS